MPVALKFRDDQRKVEISGIIFYIFIVQTIHEKLLDEEHDQI